MFVLTSLYFLGSFHIIQSVEGQMNIDSFSAKGIIYSKLLHTPLLDNQDTNDSHSINSILNNSSQNSLQTNTTNDNPTIQGGWELIVQRGEVDVFQAIFTLSKGDKVLNAFALQNLKNNKFVQMNDQRSDNPWNSRFYIAGLKNKTLSGVDVTVTLTGLTQLRISLDKNMTGQFLMIHLWV